MPQFAEPRERGIRAIDAQALVVQVVQELVILLRRQPIGHYFGSACVKDERQGRRRRAAPSRT